VQFVAKGNETACEKDQYMKAPIKMYFLTLSCNSVSPPNMIPRYARWNMERKLKPRFVAIIQKFA